MRIVAAIGLSLLVIAIMAFEATIGDLDGGLAAGLFAGAAVYDVSVGFLAYLAPLWIALARNHPETPAIAVVNLLFGWTVVGWLIAIVWALARTHGRTSSLHQSPSES